VEIIDWGTAQRIGEMIAGTPPRGGVRASSVEPLARDFAVRVAAYSGLAEPDYLPPLEAVDRSEWIAANLKSMRPMLAPLTDRLGGDSGPASGPLRAASGLMLGAQVGALTGMLSQRVLGQYDLALLDESVRPRLLLLAPNLAQAAQSLAVDRDELVLWVTIHEITHAVQFGGAPWLRGYLAGLISELIRALQPPEAQAGSGPFGLPRLPSMPRIPGRDELREMVGRAGGGQILRLTLGEDRWELVERMQSAMSLIEGHAEHTMDAVGEEVLPSLPRLRAAMNRRRSTKGLPWKVLEKLLGLEMKMRQYEIGRRFCDEVVREGGPATLALAWSGPENLPTAAELELPALWLGRVAA